VNTMIRSLFVALLGLVTLLPAQASASGFLVARFSGEHGHPTTDNPTAIYFNPAGLSLLGGTRLFISSAFAWRSASYDRNPGAIDSILTDPTVGAGTPAGAGEAANSGENTLTNYFASPFIGAVTDFGVDGLGVGLAFYVPFGGATTWDKQPANADFPGAEDGSQRWYVIDGTIRSMYLSLGVAYKIPDINLSVGAGFNTIFSTVNTLRARNATGTDHLTNAGSIQEGRGLLDVSGIDFSISGGLMWQPIPELTLGVSYQAKPAFGEMVLDGDLTLLLGAAVEPQKFDVEFKQTLPDVLRFGARVDIPTWQIRASAELARWSSLEYQCVLSKIEGRNCSLQDPVGNLIIVPRQWEDAWGFRLGASHWLSDTFELNFGVGFDQNAINDNTLDAAFIDMDKASIGVGARIGLLDKELFLSVSYAQIIYFERTTKPRARIPDPGNPGATLSDFEGATGANGALRQPDAAGTYNQAVGVLDVALEYQF
jgi:long-chain fatty acid transport protein